MPYQALLEDLRRTVDGHAALLLDSEGEVVVEVGARDMRHRLIGAYQGISLAALRRITERHGVGDVECLVCRYSSTTVILRPLKDGYYLVLSLGPEGRVAEGVHRSAAAQSRLNAEL